MNKTLHFFWFGRGEKSDTVKKCIESWQRFLPNFEIKEWNEDSFDVRMNNYVSQAYDSKKYAFVSDYARFWVLEKYGGLYFDTDVELLRGLDDEMLENEAFASRETEKYVAPGLVLWVREPHNEIVSEMLHSYDGLQFLNPDGSFNLVTVCVYFTNILLRHGLEEGDFLQKCGSFTVYPTEYFCPFNDLTGVLTKTENTYAVHWYDKTWMSRKNKIRNRFSRFLHRHLGVDFFQKFRSR